VKLRKMSTDEPVRLAHASGLQVMAIHTRYCRLLCIPLKYSLSQCTSQKNSINAAKLVFVRLSSSGHLYHWPPPSC
jgi:hypothetical protein